VTFLHRARTVGLLARMLFAGMHARIVVLYCVVSASRVQVDLKIVRGVAERWLAQYPPLPLLAIETCYDWIAARVKK